MSIFERWLGRRRSKRSQALETTVQAPSPEQAVPLLHSEVTGLPNRLVFEDRLDLLIRRCTDVGDQDGRFAVLLVDLDGFTDIVRAHGASVGQALLGEVGRRLQAMVRAADLVAHLRDDSFLILLGGRADASAAAVVATRVRQVLASPWQVAEQAVVPRCSIGIVLYPAHGPRAQLLARAELALRAAKATGGDIHAFYDHENSRAQEADVALYQALRRALSHGGMGLSLQYQPKINSRSGRLTGVEALLRWQHPELGALTPAHFVPLAERFGLIGELGQWVLNEACRQLRLWQDGGVELPVSINLSAHQLRESDLSDRVEASLRAWGVPAQWLRFEVPEAVAALDPPAVRRVFEALNALGVQVALDDYGQGPASLTQLRQLSVHSVKLDSALMKGLGEDEDARAVVDAAVRLSHALGMEVVAKGVETAQQQGLLQACGCDEMQGHLVAHPMAPDAMALWAQVSELVPHGGLPATPAETGRGPS